MIARLLYTALALCALGTYPGRAGTRAASPIDVAPRSAAPAAVEIGPANAPPSSAGGTRADFAIPPKHR